MIGVACIFEFCFFKFSALGKCGCSILLVDNLEYVCVCRFSCIRTVLSLSCLESFFGNVSRDTSPIIRQRVWVCIPTKL